MGSAEDFVFCPWPVESRLASPACGFEATRRIEPGAARRRARDELHAQATAGVVSGVRSRPWLWSRVVSIAEVDRRCSAETPCGRKLGGPWSSPPRESAGRRMGAGSRLVGGKTARTVAGSEGNCESGPGGASVEGRRFGPKDAGCFDEPPVETALVLRRLLIQVNGAVGGRKGASEVGLRPDTRLKTPRPGSPSRTGPLSSRKERWTTRPKLLACRQARLDPGSGSPQGGPAQVARRVRVACPSGESRRLGSHTVLGYSIRQSVAEVGERHLPIRGTESRKADRAGRRVARHGGPLDKGSCPYRATRV